MSVELESILIHLDAPITEALETIDRSGERLCFVVDDERRFVGVSSDGEIRRALISGKTLDSPVKEAMNPDGISLSAETTNHEILSVLSDRITAVPLLDESDRVVDYASKQRLRRIPVAVPVMRGNELSYVTQAVQSTWISSRGEFVDRFEAQFREYAGQGQALSVANGTVALHLALTALGVGPGDEVIVPNLTFAASINSVLYTGATPVLCDIDPETLNLDPEKLPGLITERTKALMVVHLYGAPVDFSDILPLVDSHELLLVEDTAEALGSRYEGSPVGVFGDAATFSFFGNKTITTGEGGMVLFRDEKVYARARMLRDHGMSPSRRYWHEEVGFNYRLTNLQAAIGVAQMEQVNTIVSNKRRIARVYAEHFESINGAVLPQDSDRLANSFWLYTLLLPRDADRDRLIADLLRDGIETRPVFYPLHEMPPYQRFAQEGQEFPGSIDASRRGISLPTSASLSLEEVHYVARSVLERLAESVHE